MDGRGPPGDDELLGKLAVVGKVGLVDRGEPPFGEGFGEERRVGHQDQVGCRRTRRGFGGESLGEVRGSMAAIRSPVKLAHRIAVMRAATTGGADASVRASCM